MSSLGFVFCSFFLFSSCFCAINGKQIQLTFNQKVLSSSILTSGTVNAGIITLTKAGVTPATVTVDGAEGTFSSDGKTLTITTLAAQKLDKGNYILSIAKDSILTESGAKLPAFTQTVAVDDTTAPSVTKAEYNPATGYIEVTFNEPLKTNATTGVTSPTVVRVNGVPYAPGTAVTPTVGTFAAKSANERETVYYINAGTSVAAGTTATVYVAGAVDAAGNHQVSYNGSITRPADATALAATSVTQQASNVVRVVFNKSLSEAPKTALLQIQDGLTVYKNSTPYTGTTNITGVTKVSSDTTGRTYDITIALTGAVAPNFGIYDGLTQELTFVFAKDSLTDVFLNKNNVNTTTLTFNKDINAPKVASTRLSADKKSIEVLFDKDLDAVAVAPTNIAVRHDGVDVVTTANWTAAVDPTNKKLLRVSAAPSGSIADATSGELKPGSYAVRLNDAAIKDTFGNANVATNPAAVTVASTTTNPKLGATIAGVSGSTDNTKSVFTVSFLGQDGVTAAKVKDTALSASNYLLDGQPLPATADIVFTTSAKTGVTITLPKNTVNLTGDALITVKDVQSVEGDVVKTVSTAVAVKDNTPAKLQSAALLSGTNTLVLTFDENVAATGYTSAQALADFDILAGTTPFTLGTTTPATATVAISGKTVTMVIVPVSGGDDNWSTIKAASTITVKSKDKTTPDGTVTTLKDANGADVVSNTTVTVTKQ